MVISPHPDDEIFGCAGLTQRLVKHDAEVQVVMLTQGEALHEMPMTEVSALVAKRREMTERAGQIVGLKPEQFVFLDWGDGRLHEIHDSESRKEELMSVVQTFNPQAIFIPHTCDSHTDHAHASNFVRRCLKGLSGRVRILHYCVLYPGLRIIARLNWKKSYILRMSRDEHAAKLKAIDVYALPKDAYGMSYSELPYLCKWKKELFFETD